MAARLGPKGTLQFIDGSAQAASRRLWCRCGIRLHDGASRSAIGTETSGRAKEREDRRVGNAPSEEITKGQYMRARTLVSVLAVALLAATGSAGDLSAAPKENVFATKPL